MKLSSRCRADSRTSVKAGVLLRFGLLAACAYTLVVAACGSNSNKQSEPAGQGGDTGAAGGPSSAGPSGGDDGEAGGGSFLPSDPSEGGSQADSGGSGAGGELSTGAGGEPNAGAGSEPGAGAGGQASTLVLVTGHCDGGTSCTAWEVPEQVEAVLAQDCQDTGGQLVSGCPLGYYGTCLQESAQFSVTIEQHQYLTLGGLSVEELEPMVRATCEGNEGVWISENF